MQMEIRADLMDAHLYAFKRYCHLFLNHNIFLNCVEIWEFTSFYFRSVLLEVLEQKTTFTSLKQDVLPYLVRSQLVST